MNHRRFRVFSRVRRRVAIVAVVSGSVLALSANAFANVPITQVSDDPYTNTTSYHHTELEPDTFAWGNTIVAVFQTGRFPGGGSDNTGFATSTDGGATWTHGFMPGTTVYADPPGPYARTSDPSIAYDAKHDVWLANSLTVDTKNSDIVNLSTDGALTWTNPIVISTPTGSSDYDKNWIACDDWSQSPNYGNCYAEVDDANSGDIVKMFTSSNGGKKWTEATVPTAHGLGGQPLAQPNGTVIVPFWGDAGDIESITSTDGGATYSAPISVSTITDHGVPFVRTEPLPSAEIDKNGKVYVVWQDCRFETGCSANDIVMTTTNDGATWSKVVRIPIDAVGSGKDHFIPGIGVDRSTAGKSAHLALTYYYFPTEPCTIETCKMQAGFVSSVDGGKTWSAPTKVLGPIKLNWLPNAGGRFVGDYISTSISGGKAFPVIANATKGKCTLGQIDSCHEFMVAPNGGLDVLGGTIRAGADRPVAGARSDHTWPAHPRIY